MPLHGERPEGAQELLFGDRPGVLAVPPGLLDGELVPAQSGQPRREAIEGRGVDHHQLPLEEAGAPLKLRVERRLTGRALGVPGVHGVPQVQIFHVAAELHQRLLVEAQSLEQGLRRSRHLAPQRLELHQPGVQSPARFHLLRRAGEVVAGEVEVVSRRLIRRDGDEKLRGPRRAGPTPNREDADPDRPLNHGNALHECPPRNDFQNLPEDNGS